MKKLSLQNHKVGLKTLCLIVCIFSTAVLLKTVETAPIRAFGGALWLNKGFHYINNEEVNSRIAKINAPKELAAISEVRLKTPACEAIVTGACLQGGQYIEKTLITPAVAYKPGTPDRKEVIGYCTLCNDGTFSPSCAVGRGACSWHGGVASYNVPEYRIIRGSPEVKAAPAVYSYTLKSFKDSAYYVEPANPSLNEIVNLR